MALDLTQMLANLGESITPMVKLVSGASYLMGIFFIYRSIMTFKAYGEMRMMSPTKGNSLGGIVFLFIGALLLYLPTGLEVFLNTFYGYGSPLAYSEWVGSLLSGHGPYAVVIVRLIQLGGLIWLVKGLMVLAYSTMPAQRPDEKKSAVALGLAYTLAGVLSINFVGTANMLSATFENLG